MTQRTICLALFLILALPLATNAAMTDDQVQQRVSSSMQDLQRFKAEHSFSDLENAINTLYSFGDIRSIAPANYVARRRSLVEAWAQILKTIEESYDPTYNPHDLNDLYNDCLTAPQATTPTCFDYQDIKDPKARADFITAIKANAVKAQKGLYYTRLRSLDDDAMTSLKVDLQIFSAAGAPPDGAALDAIIQQAGLSKSRQTAVDAMVAAPALR
ncbi:MAG TPA: hypothetical protein VMF11_03240 [Candidatus Baltobacteraceae bacterium]|nr:hypothetical protein [Candidatus Baltobacteraceae bacterium]